MKLALYLLLNSFCLSSFAQTYLGNEWFIGIQLQKISFDNSIKINHLQLIPAEYIHGGNSNICDSNGHLLFATDGFKLFDSMGNYFDGGGQFINNDSLTWEYGNNGSVCNGSLILPKGNNQYYILTSTMSDTRCYNYFHNWNNDTFSYDEIRYSIIDMNANNGHGSITVKNKLLLHVNEYPWLNASNFTACRHANGRDWWVLKPSARMRQVMYKFLVTPDSIITYKEDLPLLFNTWVNDMVGQSCFSKDGSLYAECNNMGPHTIYNFDRCSGQLSLKRLIDLYPYKDTFGMSWDNSAKWRGLCFSPNGRFLYTCDPYNVYQVDLWQTIDLLAVRRISKDTDGTSVFAEYSCMQLTPTGQIYLGNWHGLDSVIKSIPYPDKLRDSCGFNFHYFDAIETTNGPPNMPFYGLGALEGSTCDTLNPPPNPINTIIKIYPNPVTDKLNIELPTNTKKCELVICDLLGNMVFTKSYHIIIEDKLEISLGHLARSLYTIKVIADGKNFVAKFVKE